MTERLNNKDACNGTSLWILFLIFFLIVEFNLRLPDQLMTLNIFACA